MARISSPNPAVPESAPNDPRIGQVLGSALGRGDVPRAVILGFPSDEGVRRNGGRGGAAEGPTVSALNMGGLSTALWLEAAYGAGRSTTVASADVVELNPRLDADGQTARLAALTVWWLLRGRAE